MTELTGFERDLATALQRYAEQRAPILPAPTAVVAALDRGGALRRPWLPTVPSLLRPALRVLAVAAVLAALLTGLLLAGMDRPRPHPVQGIIEPTGLLVRPRVGPTSIRLADGRVLIAGGSVQAGVTPDGLSTGLVTTTTAEIYDAVTRSFTLTGDLTGAGAEAAVLLPDGDVLLAASAFVGALPGPDPNGPGPTSLDGQRFEPTTGRFVTIASADPATAFHQMLALADGRVLLLGWGDQAPVRVFDPREGVAQPVALGRSGIQAAPDASWTGLTLGDGRVLLSVGSRGPVGTFDPSTDRVDWLPAQPAAAKAIPAGISMTGLQDGRVLVLMWDPDVPGTTVGASIVDPSTGRGGPLPRLPGPGPISATVLRDGRVLLVRDATDVSSAGASLLDPSDGTVTAGPPLVDLGAGGRTVRLLDGDVLIVGAASASEPLRPRPEASLFR